MDQLLEFIQQESSLAERKIRETEEEWSLFWSGLTTYVSPIKIDGWPVLPPVMTAEKRIEMQLLKKQACLAEVRMKSRAREREFLNRVQRSLEEIQRENSEKEVPHGGVDSTPEIVHTSVNEEVHKKPKEHNRNFIQSASQSNTIKDVSSLVSCNKKPADKEIDKTVNRTPKIHRRRRTESGGSTGSDAPLADEATRQRTSSTTSTASEPVNNISCLKTSIRRTLSDKQLRRSGSERQYKHSEHGYKLRRTGSGDIPTVIRSDSNPKIVTHRRIGSGDMSSMQSRKQVAINHLTRSYDMSIRSLMSEELNLNSNDRLTTEVKVKVDTTNSQPTDDIKSLPLDNKLLSPMYMTTSTNSKDSGKLVTRPGQQKKSSPSKQPIKAIHSLPPSQSSMQPLSQPSSQPTSRENTFEALLPSGPLFPDVNQDETPKKPNPYDTVADTLLNENDIHARVKHSNDSVAPGFVKAPSKKPLEIEETVKVAGATARLLDSLTLADMYESEDEKAVTKDPNYTTLIPEAWTVTKNVGESCEGFLELPKKMLPGGDNSTQQWLVNKISQLRSSGEVDLANWLQNAPDSIKHKLSHLVLSKHTIESSHGDNDISESVDDTLRSTSPIPDNEENSVTASFGDETSVENSNPKMLIRTNSYTLEEPSLALLNSNLDSYQPPSELKGQFKGLNPEIAENLPQRQGRVKSSSPNRTDIPTRAALPGQKIISRNDSNSSLTDTSPNTVERSRALASKSYVVEKPSPALLDSLNESQRSFIESSDSLCPSTNASITELSRTTQRSAGDDESRKTVQRKLYYHMNKNAQLNYPLNANMQESNKPANSNLGRKHIRFEHDSNRQMPNQHDSNGQMTNHQREKGKYARPEKQTYDTSTHDQHTGVSNPSNKPVNHGDVFDRVRRELSLLKSKHKKRLNLSADESSDASTITNKIPGKSRTRPNAALTSFKRVLPDHLSASKSTEQDLTALRDQLLLSAVEKPAGSPGHVKSYAEKDATPIATGYSESNSLEDSVSEYSQYGGICSASHHRPATAQSYKSSSPRDSSSEYVRSSNMAMIMTKGIRFAAADKLSAAIKGHLCRRLLATSKVQCIVKTIKDCRSLLYNMPIQDRQPANNGNPPSLTSLQDLNFRERLLDQWQAGLYDIHEIFFNLPSDKKIALIQQSEQLASQAKAQKKIRSKPVRQRTDKEQQKKRLSAATMKVMERKKAQRAAADFIPKSITTSSLKKNVLAPKFAVNSPKKVSGRVSKSHLRQSPLQKSQESPRKSKI